MIDVLIIDDDEVFGDLMLDRFDDTAWTVQFHRGPFGTVNAIRACRPRLIIMDVNMPGLEGTRMSELIRKTPGFDDIRVLLYSSLDQHELDQLAKTYRVDGALHKSASRGEFMAIVDQLLGGAKRGS